MEPSVGVCVCVCVSVCEHVHYTMVSWRHMTSHDFTGAKQKQIGLACGRCSNTLVFCLNDNEDHPGRLPQKVNSGH